MERSGSGIYGASTVHDEPRDAGSRRSQFHTQSSVQEEMSTLSASAISYQRGRFRQGYVGLPDLQGHGTPHTSSRGGPPSEIHTCAPGTRPRSETSSFSHGSAMTSSVKGCTNPSSQLVTPREGMSVPTAMHHGMQGTPVGLSAASISTVIQGRPDGIAQRSTRTIVEHDFLPTVRTKITREFTTSRWEQACGIFKNLSPKDPTDKQIQEGVDNLTHMFDQVGETLEANLLNHLQERQAAYRIHTSRESLKLDKNIEQIHKAVLRYDNNLGRDKYIERAVEFLILPLTRETRWLIEATNVIRERFCIEINYRLRKKNFVEEIAQNMFANSFRQRLRRGLIAAIQAVWYQREPSVESRKTTFGKNAATRSIEKVLWIGRHELKGKLVERVGQQVKTDVEEEDSEGVQGEERGGADAAAEDPKGLHEEGADILMSFKGKERQQEKDAEEQQRRQQKQVEEGRREQEKEEQRLQQGMIDRPSQVKEDLIGGVVSPLDSFATNEDIEKDQRHYELQQVGQEEEQRLHHQHEKEEEILLRQQQQQQLQRQKDEEHRLQQHLLDSHDELQREKQKKKDQQRERDRAAHTETVSSIQNSHGQSSNKV